MIGDRWGVGDDEVTRAYPCDALVTRATMQAWRGVSVAAPPERVWPWVRQIRLAPYSYDWIDNGGRRSPRELRDLPEPQVGDPFTATAGRPQGRITAVEPGVHLTATILGAHLTYALLPHAATGSQPAERTRLVLKLVAECPRLLAPLFSVGDLIMARRQLMNLAHLAESH